MAAQPKTISQPTTFGNPRSVKDRRYYRILTGWLASANRILYPMVVGSFVVFFALLAYTGLGVDHSQIFVSDGTVFSCQIDTIKIKESK